MVLLSPLFLLTSLILVVVELPYILTPDMVRHELVSAITENLGVKAEIQALTYGVFTGVELKGVRIGPPEGFERDLVRAERVALGYDLSGILSRRLVVEEVALEGAHLVLETRDGRRNLDAVLAYLQARASPAAPEPPPTPRAPGPLLPLDVLLKDLHVGPLTVELVGEGPNVLLQQVWLRAHGEAGRERLDMQARLHTEEAPQDDLRLRLPPGEAEAVAADGDLGLELTLGVKADTRDGLHLQGLTSRLALAPRLEVTLGARALPTVVARAEVGLDLSPPQDRVTLSPVTLTFHQAPLLEAEASLVGLYATLAQQLGTLTALGLKEAVGLSPGPEPARLTLKVPRLALPLDALSPYAALFEPGAALSGHAGVFDLMVVGPPDRLQEGLPEQIAGRLGFEAAAVRLPGRALAVAGLGGGFTVGAAPEGGFALGGEVQVGATRAPGGVAFSRGAVGLEGHLPRLGVPLAGPSRLGLTVALSEVSAPGARVREARASATVAGVELLAEAREGPPVAVDLGLWAQGISAATGTVSYAVAEADLAIHADLDRLVVPAAAPIPLVATLRLPRVSGPQGLGLEQGVLQVKGTVEDPRRRVPFDADLTTTFSARRLTQGPYALAAPQVSLHLSAPGAAVWGAGPLAGQRVPAAVKARLTFGAERITGRGAMAGLSMPAQAVLEVRARPGEGAVDLTRAEVKVADTLAMSATAKVRRAFGADRWATLSVVLEKARLGPLVASLPKAYLAGFEDVEAAGEVTARLAFEGALAHLEREIDLRAAPVRLEARLELSQVGLTSKLRKVAFEGLDSETTLAVGKEGARFRNSLEVARLEVGEGDLHRRARGARMYHRFGYQAGEWQADSGVSVDAVEGAVQGGGDVQGVSGQLLVRYPTGGNLELSRLSVVAESLGLVASGEGRLARGAFGVLEPELDLAVSADFDRLRALVPGLEGVAGRAAATLAVHPLGRSGWDLTGAVDMTGFGYKGGATEVVGMSGRLPIHQGLALPEPRFDAAVAGQVGRLGDDLEARLAELAARLARVQVLVDPEDVLLVPPRHADHEALRPYRRVRGADLRAERLVSDRYQLEAVIMEAQWSQGILRLDHFEAALWDGDLLADMALQLTPDLDVRVRARGTVTNLNLDIPYALANGRAPETDPAAKEKYTTSATLDLAFALKERSLNGRVEISKLSQALVQRLFGGLALSGGGGALRALGMSERVGVRPVAAKVWIANNLLNVQFEWRRLWLHVYYDSLAPWWLLVDTALIFLRPAVIPTLGGLYVIPTMNGAIRRLPLSGFIEQALAQSQAEQKLLALAPYLSAAPAPER